LDTASSTKLQNITSIYNSLGAALAGLSDSREKLWAMAYLEQSHMWLTKTVEREQLEKNLIAVQPVVQPQPQPQVQPPQPPPQPQEALSKEAKVLAESREKIDSLFGSIQALTSAVAHNGIQFSK
jgi:hypothetical protein